MTPADIREKRGHTKMNWTDRPDTVEIATLPLGERFTDLCGNRCTVTKTSAGHYVEAKDQHGATLTYSPCALVLPGHYQDGVKI